MAGARRDEFEITMQCAVAAFHHAAGMRPPLGPRIRVGQPYTKLVARIDAALATGYEAKPAIAPAGAPRVFDPIVEADRRHDVAAREGSGCRFYIRNGARPAEKVATKWREPRKEENALRGNSNITRLGRLDAVKIRRRAGRRAFQRINASDRTS